MMDFIHTGNFAEKGKKLYSPPAFEYSTFNDVYLIKINLKAANIARVKEFKEFIFKLIETKDPKISIDLTSVKVIDSTFLGLLVVSNKEIHKRNGKFNLFGLNPSVSFTFGLTKLDKILSVQPSKERAINELN